MGQAIKSSRKFLRLFQRVCQKACFSGSGFPENPQQKFSQENLKYANGPRFMSEFQDFLKHKAAYVALGEFKPGTFAEARQLFEKAVSTYTQGFKGAYLLQAPGVDRGIAVILWDNVDDMSTHNNAVYEAALSKISHLFAKPPETGFYEVCSEIGLPDGAKAGAETES